DNTDEDGAVYYDGCLLALTKKLPAAEYKVKEGTRMIATWVFENQDDLTAITLPDGLQVLCSSAISHMVNLKTLTLPASINFIGGGFCNDCFSLATIYNYSESPYDLSDNYCFDNINTAKCTLYVPKGSRTAYQSAAEWKNFPIYEMKGVYTVTFEDWNGQELKTEKVEEGNSASAPATPEREGYTFTGWDKDLTDIQSDLTVTAQYTVNTYTVRFIDPFDESIISQQTVEYGMSAVEPDASQRKEHEGYFFVDWESDFDIILSDKDVYAYYATVKYTVAFDKGNSIVDAYYVAHGETVDEVPAAEPFDCKTFVGWRSSLTGNLMTETEILSETVTEEVTYTADYEQDYYAITLVCSHGTVTCDEEVDLSHVACGTTIHFSFVPEEGYELAGWDNYDPATGYLVEHDDIIEALTQQKAAVYFTVTYFDWNMTILGTEKVEEGKDAKGLESDPEREGYTFTGWSSPLTNITSDLNVQAQYEKKEPTALDDTDQENPAARSTKQFRNGILYINRNGILYDAAGNQVQ
ncbi:MAG: InlB B-repeat-containing protein, partial [Paludibacteraceae bacterium]|nr:InlB B-repeat-containing protein [Paludibacteraceae bacterium]